MAHHTITIRTEGGAGGGTNVGKPTSAKSQVQNKAHDSLRKISKAIRMASNLDIGGALSMSSKGAGSVLSAIQTGAMAVSKGVNLYSDVMQAKTGDSIKYHNLRQGVSRITNPISYLKQSIWEYGYLEPMRIDRQNESLNYNRQLTGNVIYSGKYQKGVF
jgi:hypothetical protein